jgi:peptidylprolyl isomerase
VTSRLLLTLTFAIAGCGAPSVPESHGEAAASPPAVSATAGATSDPVAAPSSAQQDAIDPTQFASTDLLVGDGPEVEPGNRVSVHYVAKLIDGTVVDQTQRQPFEFTVGRGEVIPGWDRGLVHMHVGGKRRLVVPPDLAYGARGVPPKIPPNATLVFDIELLAIEP